MADRIRDALQEALARVKSEPQIPMTHYVGKSVVEDIKDQIRGREINYTVIDEMAHMDHQKHLADAMLYGQSAARAHRTEKTLTDYPDHEMVMEMIRRGYAVMKLPKDGGPPEVLR